MENHLAQLSALCQEHGIKSYGAPLYAKVEGTESFTLKAGQFVLEGNNFSFEHEGLKHYGTIRSSRMVAIKTLTPAKLAKLSISVSVLVALRDADGDGDNGAWSVAKGTTKLFAE
jgi:hypothetical protein